MPNNNPYRAYWEKAQEQSLKLAQFYTPECLVDLCIELLQPKDELFDPCCGLGSFLSKAKSKDEHLKISGNDIAQDLGELPFNFSQGDYLKTEDQGHDYIVANIPFNTKKTHCQLANENFCWINKIITNTRKRALIILPAGVNSCLNPKLANERKKIIESGKLELVCQLPSHLFNKTGIAPVVWLINQEKKEKSIGFLNAEKFSEWKDKKRFLTSENIKAICQKDNWNLVKLEEIEEGNFMLVPNRYEREEPSELTPEEIDQQIRQTTKELYQMTQELDELWSQEKEILTKLDTDPDWLLKKDLVFSTQNKTELDWVLSEATPERLRTELEKLINEYYQLWAKITQEINQIIKPY